MNKRAIFFFILAGFGLVTAWWFNALGIMQGENFLTAWFTTPADWVVSADLLLSASAAIAFMIWDSRRIGFKRVWLLIALGFASAVAFVFPLYLALRELHLARAHDAYASPHGRVETFEVAGRRYQAFVPHSLNASTPVLIAHDAQNYMLATSETWNGYNWGIIEAINGGNVLPHAKRGLPLIVSVHLRDVTYRLNELAPEDFMAGREYLWDAVPAEIKPPKTDLRGNAYIDDVVGNLLPELERRYGVNATSANTAIGGSSMGGLASLYAVQRHPNKFGAALAYSTHWPIGGDELVEYLIGGVPNDGKHIFWTDRGDQDLDASYEPFHERAVALAERLGWVREKNFVSAVFYGTGHREDYWARRIEQPINWWLSKLD
jgi:predicted alpha/beta superfamily hydrolase